MKIAIDILPALRERSGAGEYIQNLTSALTASRRPDDEITVFSSSWRDRFPPGRVPSGAILADRRVPVTWLNLSWHRLEWPAIEQLTGGQYDVVHSPHPLLIPSRRASRVVTIHDLDFLKRPEATAREIKRDYAALAEQHAHRADHVVVSSAYTAGEVHQRFGLARHRITVCRAGGPGWKPRRGIPQNGPILFVGTLEPRKNVGGLLDAYALLLTRGENVPDLVLVGRSTPAAAPWLASLKRPPLVGRARHLGYVTDEERRALYESARLLVLPSFDEGFGLPVLEAMTIGVPVVASNRGALPEVLGDAGLLVDPEEPEALANAISQVLQTPGMIESFAARGIRRATLFNWAAAARALRSAYEAALAFHDERMARTQA
jgi:glycosyltransferase involved in cell wall biosynthesis